MMLMKFRSKRFSKSSSKVSKISGNEVAGKGCNPTGASEIKWELRPGGMLVQKRENGESDEGEIITLKISTITKSHDISIEATSTFGELKMILSMVTSLEPKEQRILFKGKEREDSEYLHMVGVKNMDKMLMLEDPAIKYMKLMSMNNKQITNSCFTISV